MKSYVERVNGSAIHVRVASTATDVDRLRRSGDVLRALAHPGVVQLLATEPDRLVTRWVGPAATAFGPGSLTAPEVAGLGAASATTLGDLHVLGWVHGAARPEHLLLAPDGRPVWCGLGSARRDAASKGDVQDLAALLRTLLAPASDRATKRLLAVLTDAQRGRLDAPGLARRLADPRLTPRLPTPPVSDATEPVSDATEPADDVTEPADDVTEPAGDVLGPAGEGAATERDGDGLLPGGDDEPTATVESAPAAAGSRVAGVASGTGRRRRRLRAGLAAVAACATGVVIGLHSAAGGSRLTCPAVDAGCGPVPTPHGVLAVSVGRFAVSSPGEVVVLGRWTCGRASLPAVLDPASGRVWVFDRWAVAGSDVPARLVATMRGASSLRVIPRGRGCDDLGVVGDDGRGTVLDVRTPS